MKPESLEVQIVRSLLKIPKCYDSVVCEDSIIFSFYDEMVVVRRDGKADHIRTILRDHHETRIEPWNPERTCQ